MRLEQCREWGEGDKQREQGGRWHHDTNRPCKNDGEKARANRTSTNTEGKNMDKLLEV